VEQHVKILAWLNIVFGGLGILGALAILLMFGGLAGVAASDTGDPDAAGGAAVLGIIGAVGFAFRFSRLALHSVRYCRCWLAEVPIMGPDADDRHVRFESSEFSDWYRCRNLRVVGSSE
jgi:hypothetical protein